MVLALSEIRWVVVQTNAIVKDDVPPFSGVMVLDAPPLMNRKRRPWDVDHNIAKLLHAPWPKLKCEIL